MTDIDDYDSNISRLIQHGGLPLRLRNVITSNNKRV